MATNQELRDAECEAAELRGKVKALEIELSEQKSEKGTATAELSAAAQALKAIEILTRNEDAHREAVHELAKCWRDFLKK